jgi:predicted RNA-binding Zn ribbon-like protein
MDEGAGVKFQNIAGAISLDFINTLDNRPIPERNKELLRSYQDLADWACQAEVITSRRRTSLLRLAADHPGVAGTVFRKALDLRECLYRLVSALSEGRSPADGDLQSLSGWVVEGLSYQQLRTRREDHRLEWSNGDLRLESIVWKIATSATELLTSADSGLIRMCDAETCRWFFLDRSKNHTRRWCDMKVCGNRAKARKFYHQKVTNF